MSNLQQGCKPFNLQEALAGKPVVTRIGEPVKIAGYNPDAVETHRVVGWVEGNANVFSWYENGSYVYEEEHTKDLFMAAVTKDVWVILMQRSFGLSAVVRETKEEAEAFCSNVDEILLGKTYGIHKITITL